MFKTICYVVHLQDTLIYILRKYSLSADEVYIKSLLSDLSRKRVDIQSSLETHISNSPNTSTNDSRIIETKVHRTRQVVEWNMGKHFRKPGCELATRYNFKNLEVQTRMSNHLLCGALETKDCIKSLPDINKLSAKRIKSYLNQNQTPTESIDLLHQWFKELKLNELVRVPPSSGNLATYVPNCFTLSQLVKLGVDISRIEAIPGVANMLIKLDFHNDIEPLLWKLSDFGFKPEQIARIITRFPKILKLPLCELSARLTYFTNRNVLPTDVVTIIFKIPNILEKPSIEVDKSLGQIKSLLKLKNSEVVELITREPKIIVHSLPKIKVSLELSLCSELFFISKSVLFYLIHFIYVDS
ncbi:Transcription termination factor 3, mitochondrial [Schistosoma japonicum]|nr:Transcription termination factor 3, mitochondrial [Schistosoma japonicum]KAH8865846.1 Transcription termination factor 3, mitochondrial [Schistosoma japonicum]KAH8865848.1 Transcription termination factor 3, mitochondrial [Schistosoma japonicum]